MFFFLAVLNCWRKWTLNAKFHSKNKPKTEDAPGWGFSFMWVCVLHTALQRIVDCSMCLESHVASRCHAESIWVKDGPTCFRRFEKYKKWKKNKRQVQFLSHTVVQPKCRQLAGWVSNCNSNNCEFIVELKHPKKLSCNATSFFHHASLDKILTQANKYTDSKVQRKSKEMF